MDTATLFTALADPTRRALYERLAQGEQTVHALTAQAGISQPAVSKHLAVLKAAGLVTDRRSGRESHYSLHPQGLAPLRDWMRHQDELWARSLDRLEDLLNRMDQ
ncbi:metalloregulator ArsR/SmtB family transcription factor [Asticcacaulis sp. EMRT-3]|uniref:ArsR/SmtB family transcription factor n=1 Tax=Asticcacaulis sp. EMRT-3 TaxID=3040349 RepID=UPI0024AF4662|nr:metalloregulator ArsR/SmtB family transcription factor [Asticcacaulis sp. EMRT-3]MDI7776373.1 metalloregulator ArsR/SmtB family transcription factor [Asticcacaulis sp. EMRT-3]